MNGLNWNYKTTRLKMWRHVHCVCRYCSCMHEFNHKWIHANLVSSFTLIQIHLHVEHVCTCTCSKHKNGYWTLIKVNALFKVYFIVFFHSVNGRLFGDRLRSILDNWMCDQFFCGGLFKKSWTYLCDIADVIRTWL